MSASAEKIFNNRYRVDGVLGNGGMANVYVGTDTLLRRRVAIKVLRDQYSTDDDFVKRFSYEAQSAAKLSHPNIVNVYDFGTADDSYYIVMELVDGATLADILRDDGALPEPVALDYAIQIASGLAYAHRQGLLHRDVKPANILVTKDDVVKLSDFGIARAVSEHTLGVTQPGMVMGSVAYISPEQAQGHDIDERADLYSVGVVLYQMLTGRLPFSGDTPVAVALKHVSESAPALDPAGAGVSPAVASIVARLLRKNPAERFASATELASALREARERPDVAHGSVDFGDARNSRPTAAAPPPRRSLSPDLHAASALATVDGDHVRKGPDPRWILFPLLLIAAIAIGFFALRAVPGGGPAKTIEVPDLSGRGGTAAQHELMQRGLQAKVTEAPSETVPQGQVVSQDPGPPAKLALNDVVALVVSSGLPRVQVPDVKGYSAADAQRTLTNAKLKAKVVEAYSAGTPAQQVVGLNPGVGQSVPQNSVVVLTVSKGAQPIAVPSVVSLSVEEARRQLRAVGLTLAVGQEIASDTIPANVIASQDPEPPAAAARGAVVTVVVSTGATTVAIPDVYGSDASAAQAALRAAGFEPSLSYSVEAANPTGKISGQDPPAGTKAKKGTHVTILLSVAGTVPDVTGKSLAQAKAALLGAGYQLGNIAETPDSALADGLVVRTEPEANSQLKPGESVNLTIMRAGGAVPGQATGVPGGATPPP